MCVECLIGKQKKPILFKVTEPRSIPYRTPPACAKMAAYPEKWRRTRSQVNFHLKFHLNDLKLLISGQVRSMRSGQSNVPGPDHVPAIRSVQVRSKNQGSQLSPQNSPKSPGKFRDFPPKNCPQIPGFPQSFWSFGEIREFWGIPKFLGEIPDFPKITPKLSRFLTYCQVFVRSGQMVTLKFLIAVSGQIQVRSNCST